MTASQGVICFATDQIDGVRPRFRLTRRSRTAPAAR